MPRIKNLQPQHILPFSYEFDQTSDYLDVDIGDKALAIGCEKRGAHVPSSVDCITFISAISIAQKLDGGC